MATKLLYHTDSYVREYEAKVAAVEAGEAGEGAVAFGRTAFFPGGGGQPHDTGRIEFDGGAAEVVKVKRRGEVVWHWLEGDVPGEGTIVRCSLDWERRYQLMRTHTSLHILCGVIWRDYKASVTGGNMEPLRGRLDFEFERLDGDLVREIEEKINAEVDAERDVKVAILPRAEAFRIPDLIRTKINLLPEGITEVRTIEIVGLDLQADGGTHVANTREVGRLRIPEYHSKGRINKRIRVELRP
jgi:misacylated tRNA(Ala) deacylase